MIWRATWKVAEPARVELVPPCSPAGSDDGSAMGCQFMRLQRVFASPAVIKKNNGDSVETGQVMPYEGKQR